jgi:uncharacterized membrane protein (UPF0127 family)
MAPHRQNGHGPTGEGIVCTMPRFDQDACRRRRASNAPVFASRVNAASREPDKSPSARRHPEVLLARPHFLEPLLRRTDRPLILRNARTGLAVATEIESAFTSAERRKGLLGRNGLGPGQALVIAPTNLVHTFAMRFPIDILFVARDGRVVKARSAVPARRIAGAWRGFAVIELAAGELQRSDTRHGDTIEVA